MRLNLVGGSYAERSKPFDSQRSINLYPVFDEATKEGALYPTPGLDEFSTVGDGQIRAEFASTNGRAFVVSGNGLYEVDSTGAETLLGTLAGSSSICSVAENPSQLAICDGLVLYILTYASNVFAQVADVDFPGAGTVTFQDGYFIFNDPDTGQFYITAINDGTDINALDFATAELSPDDLVRVFSAFGQLWLLGDKTTEVWYNTGDVDFPFARVEGAKMQTGCAAAHTVVEIDNTIMWVGQDDKGKGIVYRAQGYSAQRISTHALERLLQASGDLTQLRAYAYQQDGHLFYVLTGGNLETTLAFDCATQLWHERAYLEADGTYSTHRGSTCMYAFGKHLVGDKSEGKIYQMSLDFYDDDGDEIKRQRIFPHLNNEGERFPCNELQVDFEVGVGLTTGQGSAPLCWLEVSRDGGQTWGPELYKSIGAIGDYNARVVWRKLGIADTVTFRVSTSDPVKVVLLAAYLK